MREIYAIPHDGKPEVIQVAVEGATVLLRHGQDGRWMKLRPVHARELGELLTQAAEESVKGCRRAKTDDEMGQSFGSPA